MSRIARMTMVGIARDLRAVAKSTRCYLNLAIGLVLVSTVTTSQAAILGFYDFEGGPGVELNDKTTNGNHATISGALTGVVTDGTRGKVFNLTGGSGTNHLDLPMGTTTGMWTFATWFNDDGIAYLLDERDSTPAQNLILSMGQNTGDSSPGTWNGSWVASGSATVNDSIWHHVAWVYDGSDMIVYVDGIASAPDTVSLPDFSAQLFIGTESGAGGQTGRLLDDIAVFDEALNSAEISLLMNGGLEGLFLTPPPIPEPSSLTLSALAMCLLVYSNRRRRRT